MAYRLPAAAVAALASADDLTHELRLLAKLRALSAAMRRSAGTSCAAYGWPARGARAPTPERGVMSWNTHQRLSGYVHAT